MKTQHMRKRFLVFSGVAILQLIMTQVVTFILTLLFPDVGEAQQNQPVLFTLFLGISFSTGIFLAGWLAIRLGWLKVRLIPGTRLAITLAGTCLPMLLALLFYGRLEPGNPFFLVSILVGILGFFAPGAARKEHIASPAKPEKQPVLEAPIPPGEIDPPASPFYGLAPTAQGPEQLVKLQAILHQLIQSEGLGRIAALILPMAKPAIQIELLPEPVSGIPTGESKIGGDPDLPTEFPWPEWRGRPMGFIAQFNLSSASQDDLLGLLPKEGLLSFFYDLVDQPWGYDPNNLGYSHVAYFPPGTQLHRRAAPDPEIRLKCSDVLFSASLTLPVWGSRDYDALEAATGLSGKETDQYDLLVTHLQDATRQRQGASFHRLLGHSHNVQGDMQLEAELVTNGIYCGDTTGYQSPRRQQLEPQAADWLLLFQLDTEDSADLMWGDSGMLYFWIKKDDLAHRRFEKHWMDLQCG